MIIEGKGHIVTVNGTTIETTIGTETEIETDIMTEIGTMIGIDIGIETTIEGETIMAMTEENIIEVMIDLDIAQTSLLEITTEIESNHLAKTRNCSKKDMKEAKVPTLLISYARNKWSRWTTIVYVLISHLQNRAHVQRDLRKVVEMLRTRIPRSQES